MSGWNKNQPGNVKFAIGRQQILDNNDALEEALSRDHNFPGTYSVDAGEHNKITFHQPLTSDPANQTHKGFLYSKLVNNVIELFFEDENGNIIQLTSGGKINVIGYVTTDTAQDITGAKTFKATLTMSGADIVMAGTEKVDGVDVSAHAGGTAKDQHTGGLGNHSHQSDGAEGGKLTGSAFSTIFGEWQSVSITKNTVYQASTDGILIVNAQSTYINDKYLYLYTDANNPPTTLRARLGGSGGSDEGSITCPIKKNHYYKVSGTGSITNAYWLPIGG